MDSWLLVVAQGQCPASREVPRAFQSVFVALSLWCWVPHLYIGHLWRRLEFAWMVYKLCIVMFRVLLRVRSRGTVMSLCILNFMLRFGLVVGWNGGSSSSVVGARSPPLPCSPGVCVLLAFCSFSTDVCLYSGRMVGWWWPLCFAYGLRILSTVQWAVCVHYHALSLFVRLHCVLVLGGCWRLPSFGCRWRLKNLWSSLPR